MRMSRPSRSRPPRTRAARIAVVVAAVSLIASGCSLFGGPGGSTADPTSSGSAASDGGASAGTASGGALPKIGTSGAALDGDPATLPAYAQYYSQKLDWKDCGDYHGADCATLTVPRVWNDPGQGDVSLALLKLPATGRSEGTLFMNPGGPGGSGVEFVGDGGAMTVGKDVRAKYDLVGFDPRGVAGSDGIRCLDDAQTDQYVSATFDLNTTQGLADGKEWLQRVADSCQQNSADLLPYMDTESAVRDLDVMRAAVGSEKLDYLGFSYGTYLGATYAELYPERTGRFVLDGALDPKITGDELSAGQAAGFEDAVHRFSQWCIDQGASTCPLKGDADQGVQQIRDFFASVDATPLGSGDQARPLTGAMARSGVLMAMYNDESWSFLARALTAGMNGDGSQLLYMNDLANDRDDSGHYKGNGLFSITAVNCLDHPAVEDEAWMRTESERLAEEYPTFGPSMGYSGLSCGIWPDGPVRKPGPIAAKGSGLIVVIGTTHDPATPYVWAQSLAEQLDNSTLITFDGDGHTAYGRSGGCVESAVEAYLVDGTPPPADLKCT